MCNMALKNILFLPDDSKVFLPILLWLVSLLPSSTVQPQKIYSQHLLPWMLLTQIFIIANKF